MALVVVGIVMLGLGVGSFLPMVIARYGGPTPPRRWFVALLTAGVFGALALHFGPAAELPAYLYLGAVGVALGLIDLDVKRLPNALTLPSYAVGLVLLGAAALAGDGGRPFVRALLGLAALFAFYFLLALVYPAGMGFGDVKLAGVLGLYTAWIGWDVWVVGAFAGFFLGGLVGLALLLTRRAGRKSAIPFGPFMLAGAVLAILAGQAISRAYVGLAFG